MSSEKVSASVSIWPFEVASIVFAIIINTVGWNHPDIWCFNWLDHSLHNWFWVVFNTIISVPICCSFLLCLCILVPIALIIFIIKYLTGHSVWRKR